MKLYSVFFHDLLTYCKYLSKFLYNFICLNRHHGLGDVLYTPPPFVPLSQRCTYPLFWSSAHCQYHLSIQSLDVFFSSALLLHRKDCCVLWSRSFFILAMNQINPIFFITVTILAFYTECPVMYFSEFSVHVYEGPVQGLISSDNFLLKYRNSAF